MLCSKDYFVGLYFWLRWNLWTLPQNQLCVGWQDFLLVPYLVWFIYRKEKHLQDILLCWWIMFLSMIHHAVVSLKHLGSMFQIVQQTFYFYSAINYWRVKELIVNSSIRSLFHGWFRYLPNYCIFSFLFLECNTTVWHRCAAQVILNIEADREAIQRSECSGRKFRYSGILEMSPEPTIAPLTVHLSRLCY